MLSCLHLSTLLSLGINPANELRCKKSLHFYLGFQALPTTQCPSVGTLGAIPFLKGFFIAYWQTFSLPHGRCPVLFVVGSVM